MSIISQKTGFQIRPRFEVASTLSVEELYDIFKRKLKGEEAPCDGKVRYGYVSMYPKEVDHHYWSPHLSVIIEENESQLGTVIRGLYGPSPPVWLMFVFVYAMLGLATLICLVIGFANMSINESTVILWAVPFLIILSASIYLTSYYGQKKGHDQIEQIHQFFESCIDKEIR